MAAYIYAVTDSPARLADSIKGFGEAPVCNVPYLDLGVVISDLDGNMPPATQDQALRHEQVMEKLMENSTVLPFRFGTFLKSKEHVLAMMDEHYADFKDNLERLRGKAEFGIKVIWPGDKMRTQISPLQNGAPKPDPSAAPAKSFIQEKLEKRRTDRKIAEAADSRIAVLDEVFHKLAAEKKLEKLRTKNLLLNASYLVEKEKQEDFKRAFEQLKSSHNDLKYLFSGPWPPYNFIKMARCAIRP